MGRFINKLLIEWVIESKELSECEIYISRKSKVDFEKIS